MQVLLGIEANELGHKALEETVARAADVGDELTIAIYGDPEPRAELRSTVRSHLERHGLDAELVEIEDEPGSTLVDMTDRGPYDRLVIGGGIRSPMGKIQLGSVAEFVLTNTRTTVTLVR